MIKPELVFNYDSGDELKMAKKESNCHFFNHRLKFLLIFVLLIFINDRRRAFRFTLESLKFDVCVNCPRQVLF